MSWRTLRLAREEPDQVLRLQTFRAAHPEVIIGDAGFGVWQARIPEPDGERIISRYALRELSDKLDKLTGKEPRAVQPIDALDPVSIWTADNMDVSNRDMQSHCSDVAQFRRVLPR